MSIHFSSSNTLTCLICSFLTYSLRPCLFCHFSGAWGKNRAKCLNFICHVKLDIFLYYAFLLCQDIYLGLLWYSSNICRNVNWGIMKLISSSNHLYWRELVNGSLPSLKLNSRVLMNLVHNTILQVWQIILCLTGSRFNVIL